MGITDEKNVDMESCFKVKYEKKTDIMHYFSTIIYCWDYLSM